MATQCAGLTSKCTLIGKGERECFQATESSFMKWSRPASANRFVSRRAELDYFLPAYDICSLTRKTWQKKECDFNNQIFLAKVPIKQNLITTCQSVASVRSLKCTPVPPQPQPAAYLAYQCMFCFTLHRKTHLCNVFIPILFS